SDPKLQVCVRRASGVESCSSPCDPDRPYRAALLSSLNVALELKLVPASRPHSKRCKCLLNRRCHCRAARHIDFVFECFYLRRAGGIETMEIRMVGDLAGPQHCVVRPKPLHLSARLPFFDGCPYCGGERFRQRRFQPTQAAFPFCSMLFSTASNTLCK